jgi:hypothetical protein
MTMDPTEITRELNARIAAFQETIDPARLAAEEAEKMAPFEREWKHAPASEKRRSQQQIRAEQLARQRATLFPVGRFWRDVEPILEAAVEQAKRAPSALEATQNRAGTKGLPLEVELLTDLFDETLTARLLPTLKSEKPTRWLERYNRAVLDPSQRRCGTELRLIETLMAGPAWAGPPVNPRDEPTEAAAIQKLQRRIAEVQDSRIGPELRAAVNAVKHAKHVERQAEQLHGIVAQNPELVRR